MKSRSVFQQRRKKKSSNADIIVPPSPELMARLNAKATALVVLGKKPRELRVVRTATSEIVHHVPISSDKSDRQVEKVMSETESRIVGPLRGMLRNMADEFHVEDSGDDK